MPALPDQSLLPPFPRDMGVRLVAADPDLVVGAMKRRCCRTRTVKDSHRESMRFDGRHEQIITRPLPHRELVRPHCVAAQAQVAADLVGQGDDLARAA